jgi:hypothetical protein
MGMVIAVLTLFIFLLNDMVKDLSKRAEAIERYQYEQDKEFMKLMRYKLEHDEMLLQHIEILKYLIEQDPMLGKQKRWIVPVGEA